LYVPDRKETKFTGRIFAKLVKSRYNLKKNTKPFLVGPLRMDNILPQITKKYTGGLQENVWEMYLKSKGDDKFQAAISKVFGVPPKDFDPSRYASFADPSVNEDETPTQRTLEQVGEEPKEPDSSGESPESEGEGDWK
jgi:hypothetical protein